MAKEKKITEQIETALCELIMQEYNTAKTQKQNEDADFESYIDLFDCNRSEKNYDWMADIFVPELLVHMVVQMGIAAGQYFKRRDYVEVYVMSEKDKDIAAAEANKRLVNRTLNQKHLYYYQKFIRAEAMRNLGGAVYLRCWWERKTRKAVTGQQQKVEAVGVDEAGQPIQNVTQVPVYGEKLVYDRFNYDLVDQRDIFTSNEYAYSLQEKNWVTIRFDSTPEELEAKKELMGYINLDKLKKAKISESDTETKGSDKGSYYSKDKQKESTASPIKNWMCLERYGKHWVKVTKRDELDNPIEIVPGIDSGGLPLEDAELLEVVITEAVNKSTKYLIRFQLQTYKDTSGETYRPLLRGLCYIHPTMDAGFGDGKATRELQIALNDTINMSFDRTKFATVPTLINSTVNSEHNDSVYFEPYHIITVPDPDKLKEFKIADNITGALHQSQFFIDKMQQATATFPTTQGSLPEMASTTATAIAGADSRTDTRSHYRSLNNENTLLVELYWMITQMTWQFAMSETASKLLGDKVYDFNPELDYTYKPVSEAIETATSKNAKIQQWTQVLQYMMNSQNPKAPVMINYILGKIAALMGEEYVNFADKLLDQNVPPPQTGQGSQPAAQGMPASNQSGMPQSQGEMQSRMMAGARG